MPNDPVLTALVRTSARIKPMPTPDAQKAQLDFASRLEQLMKAKGLSQSELARTIWGSTKDGRGYSVARNRDRISSYLAGAGMPEPENLKKLADALDCTIEDLAGPGAAERPLTRRQHIEVQMQLLNAHEPGPAMVQGHMVMSLERWVEILQIVQKVRDEAAHMHVLQNPDLFTEDA